MRVEMTKEEFMHAYASQYYDPVKAHEYYMRTRQLKGRTTSGMSEEQKKTEKKQKAEEGKAAATADISQLREEAAAVRVRLSDKLRAFLERLTGEVSSKKEGVTATAQQRREQLLREKQAALDAIPKIPTTASKEQQARMREQNAQKSASINQEYGQKLADVSQESAAERQQLAESAAKEKAGERTNVAAERKSVGENLKAAIAGVREKAKLIREALNTATEETLQREWDNIMKNIAGKKKSSKKAASGSTPSRQTGSVEKIKAHLKTLKV